MIRNDHKDVMAARAGRYIQQPTGYRAFIPAPLPPDPPIVFDDELLDFLSRAMLALGRLDSASDLLPNPDLFVAMYVRREAVLSSQIEGTQASLLDVLAFESDAVEPENPQDVEEVVNYVAALNHGLKRLESLPLSLRLLRQIHERLLSGVRGAERGPGMFRTSQNWIGYVGATIETATFVPPPPAEMLKALGDVELFLHAADRMVPLIKIGLTHVQFETIHPFLDGNGRIGRLLITFLLCQRGILRRPLLYLSHYFKQNKIEYYERLQRVRDNGEWEEWLKFFLIGICTVAEEAASSARAIVSLRERHRDAVMAEFQRGAGTALQILEYLYQHPIVTVKSVTRASGLTVANANLTLRRLEALGIIDEVTGRERNRRFEYSEYLALFLDEDERVSHSSAPASAITRARGE